MVSGESAWSIVHGATDATHPALRTNSAPVVTSGTLGACALSCFYGSLHFISLGPASVLFFTSPILTGILARIVLKEQMHR